MQTLRSTPSPMPGRRPHPVGFNDQTYYDPFFPTSNDEEHLVAVPSPSHRSLHSTSPQPQYILKSNDGRPTTSASNTSHPPQLATSQVYNESRSPHSHADQDTSYGFLSPNPYLSDNGYNASSEHTATPEYDGFYLEAGYDILPPHHDMGLSDPATFQHSHLNQTSADIESPGPNYNHRASIGGATLSSHLMSPVLTDNADPSSRNGSVSPPPSSSHIKNERMATTSFQINTAQAQMSRQHGPMQHTPTDTHSSMGTSPDMTVGIPDIGRAASPVVRVEKYTRGDSPANSPNVGRGVGGKRSWTGSHTTTLAVQNEGSEGSDDGDDHVAKTRTGLDPDARFRVGGDEVPNFKEQELSAHVVIKNADVEEWLDRSASGSDAAADLPPERPSALSKKQRAKSAGAQSLSHANLESLKTTRADWQIPGPGVLIDEESGEDDSELDEDAVASIDEEPAPTTALGENINNVPGEARPGVYDELPNQPPLYRAKVWQDPLYDSSDPGVRMQPVTSNDAMMRYEERAGEMETMSRVATWGTRRMSESDLESIFHRFTISDKERKSKRERSTSFLQHAAAKLVPRRNFSLKRNQSEKTQQQQQLQAQAQALAAVRPDSADSHKASLLIPQPSPRPTGLQRMTSLGKRSRTPRIDTGSAIATMASQMAVLGGSGSVSATALSSPTVQWTATPTRKVLGRHRSRSDLNLSVPSSGSRSATELGSNDLWPRQTPSPHMTSHPAPKIEDAGHFNGFNDVDEDDDDDGNDDHGVTMDLSIRPDAIVPTLEGFKANIRQLNPRLPPFMFDRIAQEQLRRFKKLMDFKIKHAQALAVGKCSSGKHCTELGGEPTYLPSKSSSREPDMPHAGFSVSGLGPSDDDVNALAEGLVTPAQFPPGVPMPPVKRLAAEFECSLCFKVKKFHKPSDWSKHVHEDVQPFTCTFATCAEPKSFKRKADWVRHENERHRQLEWWMCNMNDCSHKCYRKDNFVQHLVREHKLPEPKVKTTKTGKPAVRGPSSQKARNSKHSDMDESNDEIDQVWKLVEECRHETPKNPKDEACKFCGNVCNSWKKLTVHLAKHMEQISMPVLGVVKQKEVTAETMISPIEHRMASHQASMSPHSPFTQGAISPYGVPVSPLDGFTQMRNSSAYFGNSPSQEAMTYQRASPTSYPPPSHSQQLAAAYAQRSGSPYPVSEYSSFAGSPAAQFTSINAQSRGFSTPQASSADYASLRAPTSQPRSTPSGYDDSPGFQYINQPQQPYASPIEESVYQFGGSPSPQTPYAPSVQMGTGSPTFGSQQQSVAMQQYNLQQMQEYAQTNGNANLYSQQQHAYGYQQ